MTNILDRLVPFALIFICAFVGTVSARTKTSLNAGWKFHKGDEARASGNDFSHSSWQGVNLPHTWNVKDPWDDEPGYYRGPAWYRRELTVGRQLSGKHLFLYFEGANQVADVYVNGAKAGSHIGGYSAFAFDITGLVKPGARNVIAVRVDNSFSEDIPPLTADFNFYGGIYRDVWLIATDGVHFDITDHASSGLRINTPKIESGNGTVFIQSTIVNNGRTSRNVQIESTVLDRAGRKVAATTTRLRVERGERHTFSHSPVVEKPRLWSPESPYLYTVRSTIRESGKLIDEIDQPLGFRWFSFDGEKGFTLNGSPMKLRGTNRHQDYNGIGNALPDRLHIRDMELIKDAGFNFVRLAHYPQDPSVLEACDRLGLLVWEETPIVNYITRSEAFTANSATMVREMIRQHRNHPSVILWGYMNEIFLRVPKGRDDLYPATVELARELNRIAKEEDPTRPTTIAFHGNDVYNKTGLGEIPDVIGWNLYQGWYSATLEDFGKFLDEQHRRFPKRPLIVSEYGANGDQRLHSNRTRRFDSTIEYQRQFHESYWAQIKARPYLSGSAIWSEFDFGSEYRGETIPHLNQKGMFTIRRTPKDLHYFYKAQLSDQKVLHIAVRDVPRRSGAAWKKEVVDVYTNLDSVELFVNGKSLGRKSVDDTRRISWEVVWSAGRNTLTARGAKGSAAMMDSAVVTFNPISVTSNEIAINVGSNADFTDSDGRIWMADKPYSKGGWGYTGSKAKQIYSEPPDLNVIGTDSDPIFQTMVAGLEEYRIDVPDGEYDVELLFADKRSDRPGQRVFDVLINGRVVMENFDPVASAGRSGAITKSMSVASSGGISIQFRERSGNPILNGVRIRRRSR